MELNVAASLLLILVALAWEIDVVHGKEKEKNNLSTVSKPSTLTTNLNGAIGNLVVLYFIDTDDPVYRLFYKNEIYHSLLKHYPDTFIYVVAGDDTDPIKKSYKVTTLPTVVFIKAEKDPTKQAAKPEKKTVTKPPKETKKKTTKKPEVKPEVKPGNPDPAKQAPKPEKKAATKPEVKPEDKLGDKPENPDPENNPEKKDPENNPEKKDPENNPEKKDPENNPEKKVPENKPEKKEPEPLFKVPVMELDRLVGYSLFDLFATIDKHHGGGGHEKVPVIDVNDKENFDKVIERNNDKILRMVIIIQPDCEEEKVYQELNKYDFFSALHVIYPKSAYFHLDGEKMQYLRVEKNILSPQGLWLMDSSGSGHTMVGYKWQFKDATELIDRMYGSLAAPKRLEGAPTDVAAKADSTTAATKEKKSPMKALAACFPNSVGLLVQQDPNVKKN